MACHRGAADHRPYLYTAGLRTARRLAAGDRTYHMTDRSSVISISYSQRRSTALLQRLTTAPLKSIFSAKFAPVCSTRYRDPNLPPPNCPSPLRPIRPSLLAVTAVQTVVVVVGRLAIVVQPRPSTQQPRA
jgi:hypothetical protein